MKDTTPIRIIFVCGPSGAGKTTFAESLAAKYGWLHVPADPIPGGRFEHLGFRLAWRAFDRFGIGRLLAMDLRRTAAARGATGCVVTFPSNIVIPSDHPAALANGIDVVYLHGSREHCIRAYLEREKETGRNFPLGRWERFNDDLYARLERPGFAAWKIEAFSADGRRLSFEELEPQFDRFLHTADPADRPALSREPGR